MVDVRTACRSVRANGETCTETIGGGAGVRAAIGAKKRSNDRGAKGSRKVNERKPCKGKENRRKWRGCLNKPKRLSDGAGWNPAHGRLACWRHCKTVCKEGYGLA